MKNIITILLIFIIPIILYLFLSNKTTVSQALAQNTNRPEVIIFTSTMCHDCKRMKEMIKETEGDYTDKIIFTKINALDNNKKVKSAIEKYEITLVPTTVFTDKNGNEKNKITGYIPKEEFTSYLEGLINE